jgi:hypothetical protein
LAAAIAGAHAYAAEVKADETLSPRGEALVRQIQVRAIACLLSWLAIATYAGARAVIEATRQFVMIVSAPAAGRGGGPDSGRADRWFVRAVHDGPSIPFAYADWGQSLLARGHPMRPLPNSLSHIRKPAFRRSAGRRGEA